MLCCFNGFVVVLWLWLLSVVRLFVAVLWLVSCCVDTVSLWVFVVGFGLRDLILDDGDYWLVGVWWLVCFWFVGWVAGMGVWFYFGFGTGVLLVWGVLFCGAVKCFWRFELFWCLFGISGFW